MKNTDIDYSSNCGNMTSAIGPYSYDEKIVDDICVKKLETGEVAHIRMHNTNTGKIIVSRFEVEGGEALAAGDFAIDGVAGTASRIQLDFLNPAGSKTGKILPSGTNMEDIDGIMATCIDVANPCICVLAKDMNVSGTILPEQIQAHPTLLVKLEKIRRIGSVRMGISKSEEDTPASIPKICLISEPVAHTLISGKTLTKDSADLIVRAISVGQPHLAVPVTVALSVAAAAKLPGSIVERMINSRKTVDTKGITIGHPSGKLVVDANFENEGTLKYASVFRTARRLMAGTVYFKGI